MTADRKLPGNSRLFSFGYPEELWLREDHLLCVSISPIYENYQRFYYRDIECLAVTPTHALLLYNILFAAFPLFGIVLLLLDVPAKPVVLSTLTPWLLLTLINFALGPTCKTTLRTRINTRTLSSLRRRRTANKALAVLNARILAAQAAAPDLAPAAAEAEADGADAPSAPAAEPALDAPAPSDSLPPPLGPAEAAEAPPPLPPPEPVSLRWHLLSAFLGVLQGVLAINAALSTDWGFAAALAGVMLLTSFACVPALISHRRQMLPAALRTATGCLTAFQFLAVYPPLIGGGVCAGAYSQSKESLYPLAQIYSDAMAQHAGLRAAFVAFAAISFALVLWQALAMRSVKRS